ncbi:MAG: metalloregulator ArsR/SmtB family transcription factor [Gammaproteobacteria bacterium]|nr:metalloregulator ArsR/SmtB family transcription factor [Gammaproteobacteria bacterium]
MYLEPEIFFKALSDPTRLRCLMLLASERTLCVCELTHALDMIQPKISRHLALLRDAGIVQDQKQGQWVYYRLHPELPSWAKSVLRDTARGIAEEALFAGDRNMLASMSNRPGTSCCT